METRGAQRAAAPLDFADPRMGDRRARFRWPAFAVKRGNDDRDDTVPIAASRRPLLGITAAVRATAPALRFLHPADVVGLAVKRGNDHRDDTVPIAASRRPLLGITAAVRATAPALRFLHPADVVGLAV